MIILICAPVWFALPRHMYHKEKTVSGNAPFPQMRTAPEGGGGSWATLGEHWLKGGGGGKEGGLATLTDMGGD